MRRRTGNVLCEINVFWKTRQLPSIGGAGRGVGRWKGVSVKVFLPGKGEVAWSGHGDGVTGVPFQVGVNGMEHGSRVE